MKFIQNNISIPKQNTSNRKNNTMFFRRQHSFSPTNAPAKRCKSYPQWHSPSTPTPPTNPPNTAKES